MGRTVMPGTAVQTETTADIATLIPPLRRNWRFQTLWLGSTAALTGIFATDIAYPLVILALTGSPATAGLFGFVQAAATVLCGLPAGQLVDRYDRRLVQVAAESVRVLATASIALSFALGRVTPTQLMIVGALVGAAQPFVGAARMLTVRSVVAPEQLTAALTQDEIRGSVAELAGPPLGGLLYGLARLLPFLFSTVGFALSLVSALVVRTDNTGAAARRKSVAGAEDGGIFAGIKALWRDRTVRAVVVLLFFLNASGAPLSLAAVYRLTQQGAPSWGIGLAMTGSALGGLAGAGLVRTLHRRFRPGVLLLGVVASVVLLVVLLGLVSGPWMIALVLFGTMLGIPSITVLLDVLIFRQVPDEVRGRTLTSVMTVMGLGIPLGTGSLGLLLQYVGGTGAMEVLAAVLACGTAWAALQPGLRAARWPADKAEAGAGAGGATGSAS
ncbi:MFS transporter [Streptacidiphilus sp. N1-3]|uniref:MFS transporter n=1 Tax=Streptacidiphilus alkalitolerans TaxID=3342712 RepID=A0ABV6WTN1_9ACTN